MNNDLSSYVSLRVLHSRVVLVGAVVVTIASIANAQAERDQYLDLETEPLAKVAVQSVDAEKTESYSPQDAFMMYRPEQEDALSLYARTQDGEWPIPVQVDRNDPWVRILVLSNPKPALIDIAIEVDGKPFRLIREAWIDQLQAEAKAVFLVRAGAEIADAVVETAKEKAAAKAAPADVKEETSSGDASAKTEAEEEVPMTAAQRRATQTASRQLINYLAANQSTVDREEVRWLLAERAGGPTLLTLGSASSWKRANEAPLWRALDLDADGALSAEEIDQAEETLKRADINQDENIDLNELERLGKQRTASRKRKSHPLVVVIDENTDWKALGKYLRKAYPAVLESNDDLPLLERIRRGDRSLRVADLMNLSAVASQLVCQVAFGSESSSMALLSTVEPKDENWQFVAASNDVITIEQQSTYMELTAAQGAGYSESSAQAVQQTQVAIGAAVDGYPLFRLLDGDNNRRLTLRERRSVAECLTNLDKNDDGKLDVLEMPTAIRVAVTRGPQVHQHLAEATAAQRREAGSSDSTAPAWFAGMDSNRDGDISRREFPGSSAQFAEYDRDGDGLISKKEANK